MGISAEDVTKRSRSDSSWLLSNQDRPRPHHHSLPRRGYSVSRSASCVSGKEAGASARADNIEGQDCVHMNCRTSISGASNHYEQLRGRSTSQTSSTHYEVMSDENHTLGSFDDGYDRVREPSNSIFWYICQLWASPANPLQTATISPCSCKFLGTAPAPLRPPTGLPNCEEGSAPRSTQHSHTVM